MKKHTMALILVITAVLIIFSSCEKTDGAANDKSGETTAVPESVDTIEYVKNSSYNIFKEPEVNSVEEAEKAGQLNLPIGTHLLKCLVEENDTNMEQKPYNYELVLEIPKNGHESFLAYLNERFTLSEESSTNSMLEYAQKSDGRIGTGNELYLYTGYIARYYEFIYVSVLDDEMLLWIKA